MIRVLICDRSAVMSAVLSSVFNQYADIEVAGVVRAVDLLPQMLKRYQPDVLTLDCDFAGVGEAASLERALQQSSLPVVWLADATHVRPPVSGKSVCVVTRPPSRSAAEMSAYARNLATRVRGLAGHPGPSTVRAAGGAAASVRVVLLGASTGGTEALRIVLESLPAQFPPVMIVQHMPEMFTGSFAKRLDKLSALHVKEAEEGDVLAFGTAYLAPGHSHLALLEQGGKLLCRLSQDAPVNRHRPSVDVLFHSAARILPGGQALAALMTGMGKDGALGLLALRRAGAWTIAQDERSCVVYGMPREAVTLGAACEVLPLQDIAAHLCQRLALRRG